MHGGVDPQGAGAVDLRDRLLQLCRLRRGVQYSRGVQAPTARPAYRHYALSPRGGRAVHSGLLRRHR